MLFLFKEIRYGDNGQILCAMSYIYTVYVVWGNIELLHCIKLLYILKLFVRKKISQNLGSHPYIVTMCMGGRVHIYGIICAHIPIPDNLV